MNKVVYKFSLTDKLKESCKSLDFSSSDFLPTKSDDKSSGWDVRCAVKGGVELLPHAYFKIPLGFRMIPESGWWAELRPRSSTFIKKHIHSLYGVIDESYEGEVCFCGQYIPDEKDILCRSNFPKIEFGDKIGQLIPVKRQEMIVSEICNEEFDKLASMRGFSRGSGGFGSTDG